MLLSKYRVTQHYGGPEEGGWWYDWYEFEGVHLRGSPKQFIKPQNRKAVIYTPKGNRMVVGRCSAIPNGGDTVFIWEKRKGEHQSTERPHYE